MLFIKIKMLYNFLQYKFVYGAVDVKRQDFVTMWV